MNHKVFVSYSHSDKKHLDRLRVHLKPLERAGAIDLWSDIRINAGDNWREEISSAIEGAEVAILLISADFLASQFIADNELPPLLNAATEKGIVVLPIIIGACRFAKISELSCFQAVNDPNRPIGVLPVAEREKFWVKLSDAVEAALVNKPINDGWTVSNGKSVLEALHELLHSGEGKFLIVSSDPYYVQFMIEPYDLIMEAVSNQYLPAKDQISLKAQAELKALGFIEPGETEHNYEIRVPLSSALDEVEEIAAKTMRVFREIYKVSSNSKLVFQPS